MKVYIEYVSETNYGDGPESRFGTINSLDDLLALMKKEGHDLIISFPAYKKEDEDFRITVFNEFIS